MDTLLRNLTEKIITNCAQEASIFVMVCGSGFTKVAAFDRAITVESLWHRRCGFVPAGKFPTEEKKAMQMERGTKLLKRVWKGVVYAELAMMAGATLFLFSHSFSYSVFVSNLSSFHRLATAATPVQPR
jgi:hypothetical protein